MTTQQKWTTLASEASIQKTLDATKARGINSMVVGNKEEAMVKLHELIPAGSEVMTGSSTTLDEIGFNKLLASGSPFKSVGATIRAENDEAKRNALRKQAVLSDYFLGSVHAVAETGEMLAASRTGSQFGPYAFTSSHVILVVSTQKIVPTLSDALERIRTHVYPLEDQRMKRAMGPQASSMIGKILIIENEAFKGRLTLVLVKEHLGF